MELLGLKYRHLSCEKFLAVRRVERQLYSLAKHIVENLP